jgi:hypothetical protein
MRAFTARTLVVTLALVAGPSLVAAQTFNSGSTGADGAFTPTADSRLTAPPDGVFNFTTISIPAGVTVSFVTHTGLGQPPISLLATGNVLITGSIDVAGADGGLGGSGTQLFTNAGTAGPGGFDGGGGSNALSGPGGAAGLGPGGGGAGTTTSAPGAAGHVSAGAGGASAGRPYGDERLVPLIGGSGGGGGAAPAFGVTGGGGGGGGGALLIASSGTITLNGSIVAAGGTGAAASFGAQAGASGSGGAVRLAATAIAGKGSIDVRGGPGASGGRIRVEAFTSTATIGGGVAGGVTVGQPDGVALGVVELRIVSVAGVRAPANPRGSYGAPDVILPAGTTTPVTVGLEASQIPLGTTVTVTATPLSGAAISAVSTPLIGTPAAATASATLAIPTSQPSVISATAAFMLSGAP